MLVPDLDNVKKSVFHNVMKPKYLQTTLINLTF